MCNKCENNQKNALKDALLKKLAELNSGKSCEYQNDYSEESCQEGSCEEVDEHLDELAELLENAQTAIAQIQDMVEELEETLDDVKEAIGQTEEDLENAQEIIENLR